MKNDVVQFNENHKWCGCLGIISEVKKVGDDIRYMVGVPIPESGIAYVFVGERDIEFIGEAVLIAKENEDE